jgi:hypothetical protein
MGEVPGKKRWLLCEVCFGPVTSECNKMADRGMVLAKRREASSTRGQRRDSSWHPETTAEDDPGSDNPVGENQTFQNKRQLKKNKKCM